MNKNLRWKLVVIGLVVAAAVWMFYPPQQKVKLGLDLKGGVHLVLRVQTDDVLKLETELTTEHLRQALTEKGVTGPTITAQPPTKVVVANVTGTSDAAFRAIVKDQQIDQRFDLS